MYKNEYSEENRITPQHAMCNIIYIFKRIKIFPKTMLENKKRAKPNEKRTKTYTVYSYHYVF